MSELELDALMARRRGPVPKPSKYRNVRCEVDGEKFDSKKEAARWHQLNLEQRAGLISNLRRQVPFELTVNGRKVAKYVADFTYRRDGEAITEDVKGVKTAVYLLKRNLMMACHGITILETR